MSFELKEESGDFLKSIQDKLLGSLAGQSENRGGKLDIIDMEFIQEGAKGSVAFEMLKIEDITHKGLAKMILDDFLPELVDFEAVPEENRDTFKAMCLTRIYKDVVVYHEHFLESEQDWSEEDTMAFLLATVRSKQI
ncbi:hypothetical protein [Vibrio phage Va2]|nr:hypothetical protein [Vibrio phage Va2]